MIPLTRQIGRSANMIGRVGASTAIVAVATAFLMVFVLPAGIAAAASPEFTPGSANQLWAYGVVRTVDFSGVSAQGYSYQGSATYGYSVILDQTNLTSPLFELSAVRTMGADLTVEYCLPDCHKPTVSATVSHHAWESTHAWANFTTNGTVAVNGQSVAAIALLNSHSTVVGNLTDISQGPLRTSYLSANVSASASVTFATPLGLLPDNLTAPMSWTSTSAFNATGAFAISYFAGYTGPHLSTHVGPTVTTGAVTRSGSVTVSGSSNSGPDGAVQFGGVPYLNVSLNVVGPFVAREGFILVPSQVDLFAASNANPWGNNETGGTSVQMTSLYVRPGAGAHVGIDGSEWMYAGSALNPGLTSLDPIGAGVAQISPGADNVSSTPVQGVPIQVDQAQGYQGCLVSGSGCAGSSSPSVLPFFGIGVLAVVIAVVVASVLVVERRRVPPPTYPNAQLYPPGETTGVRPLPGSRPSAVRPPPPAEDDPLSNLW
jgi:hypothetical protein